MSRVYFQFFAKISFCLLVLVAPMAAQTAGQTESQFISSVMNSVNSLTSQFSSTAKPPIVFAANVVYAHAAAIDAVPLDVLLDYVDGLKAAGAQRIEFNPGVTSLSNPDVAAKYDAMVQHIRQLGLGLAINPEFWTGELPIGTFQDFQSAALQSYPQLAARYQPDNFVIVHEPTTMAARMGINTTVQDWDGFIRAAAPLIQAASPHSQLGAGDFYSTAENLFYEDFVTIPVLNFTTMDIYTADHFPQFQTWAQLAKANGKSVYIEETWAPEYLPSTLPPDWQVQSLDAVSLIGPASPDFASIDEAWLQAMAMFASANGMQSVVPFITETFFAYGTTNHDKTTDPIYAAAVKTALEKGQLTPTAQAYQTESRSLAIPMMTSISSASFATLSSVFTCGCYADSAVAPDELVGGFGTDLATMAAFAPSTTYPTELGGTKITLLDSSNTVHDVPLQYVSATQVNYLVPAGVKSGPATLTVTNANGAVTAGVVLVEPVAPGIYTADASGHGPAAALAITEHADSPQQTTQYTFNNGCTPGNCVTQPIDLGASTDTVVLVLFGTGWRHVSSVADVSVQIKGKNVPAQFAGAQTTFPGLDQINAKIPHSLAGSGEVNVTVTVQDTVNNVSLTSNTVTINIK